MTSKKIVIGTLVFMLFSIVAFSQKSNILYAQSTGKNGSFSMNYDRKLGTYHDATGHYSLYGHVGIGQITSQEIIATKFIKGSQTYSNTGSLLLDILIFGVTYEADKTIERKQFFDVTNYFLGGKILLGNGQFNGIVGLDVRLDRVNQTIEAWEQTPQQVKNFNKAMLSPSVGLRWNKDYFMAQLVLAPQTIYGVKGSTDGVVSLGLGIQF